MFFGKRNWALNFLVSTALVLNLETISPASAGLVAIPYSEWVRTYDKIISDILVLYDLPRDFGRSAKRKALTFILLGPCKGGFKTPDGASMPFTQLMANDITFSFNVLKSDSRLRNVYSAENAIYASLLAGNNLGRQPGPHVCRYAAENALESIPAGTKFRYCFSEHVKSEGHKETCKTF